MSSRRKLKKDINDLCFEVINECFVFLDYTPTLNQENVQLIISDAVDLRNKLVHKVNHPENGNVSAIRSRTYYRQIKDELFDQTIDLIERLNGLSG